MSGVVDQPSRGCGSGKFLIDADIVISAEFSSNKIGYPTYTWLAKYCKFRPRFLLSKWGMEMAAK